jgi:hypothetical protein
VRELETCLHRAADPEVERETDNFSPGELRGPRRLIG